MSETLIGYARCSTDEQDLTAQRQLLLGLGVASDRIYLDHGLTGTNRNRPGLNQALAAVCSGDTLVVPKLDRLARSVPDARAIGDSLVARAKGRLRGKQPKLSARQQAHLVQLHQSGQHTIAELAELFSVSRPTVYRVLERARGTSTNLSAGNAT